MRDLDLSQYVEADRREVDPPIEVEAATWSLAARSTGESKSAGSDWEGFAVQTDRIDVYQVHHIDERVSAEEFWGTYDLHIRLSAVDA